MDVDRVADRLAASFRTGESAEPVSLSLADGYRVQEALAARLTETHGPVVGYKLGFTNRAVQREIGVDEPVYGRLLSETVGVERVQRAATVAPRAEPEIVVRVGEPLPADATRETVAERVAAVAPAVEIVDSRTAQWELAPGPAVADDALAARLAVGPERPLDAVAPLADQRVRITAGDRERTGRGSAVLGDPLAAVAWLAGADGPLPAGTLVSTGSLTETVPLPDRPDGAVVRAAFEMSEGVVGSSTSSEAEAGTAGGEKARPTGERETPDGSLGDASVRIV